MNEERLTHAARVVDTAVHHGGYASAVLAVANRTEIVWQHVAAGSDPVQWDSIFSIASISKPVTITAFMQLVERGYVVLRDPVTDYIPEFGQNGKERVTLWHLVTHTSGLDELRDKQIDAFTAQRAPSARTLIVCITLGSASRRAPTGKMRKSRIPSWAKL